MSEKLQEVNTYTTFLVDPPASKGSIAFKGAAVDGQKAIIKNATDKSIYFRGDVGSGIALASFPDTAGATPVEGVHIMPGTAESYELVKGMTQLSCFPYGGSATGLVSVKIGNGS